MYVNEWGGQSCVCEAAKQVGKCGHGEGRVVYVKQPNKWGKCWHGEGRVVYVKQTSKGSVQEEGRVV